MTRRPSLNLYAICRYKGCRAAFTGFAAQCADIHVPSETLLADLAAQACSNVVRPILVMISSGYQLQISPVTYCMSQCNSSETASSRIRSTQAYKENRKMITTLMEERKPIQPQDPVALKRTSTVSTANETLPTYVACCLGGKNASHRCRCVKV